MQEEMHEASSSFSLLRYEINRVKSHMETHGETPNLQERLERLESLLQTCLNAAE